MVYGLGLKFQGYKYGYRYVSGVAKTSERSVFAFTIDVVIKLLDPSSRGSASLSPSRRLRGLGSRGFRV